MDRDVEVLATSRGSLVVGLASLLLASACEGDSSHEPFRPDGGRSGTGEAGIHGPVTYYENVRPILVENCTMCHQEGGIAPFGLETYTQVSEVGERMREVTADRIMPPFLANNSGDCNTWSNYRGLSDEEIATLGAWIDGGKLEGDPSTPAPAAPELPGLSAVDVTLEMPAAYDIDEASDDDYRCFVVESETTEDAYVTGYDVHPGNPQRVHHVIVYTPTSDAEAEAAIALDEADGTRGDGYVCFGGPRIDAPPMVLWAPGTGATHFPRGTGVALAAGRPVVIQVHYNNLGPESPNTDRTTIDLTTSPTANPAYLIPLFNHSLNLPPRMESVTQSRTQSLAELPVSVRVHGVFPHMHTLGRQLRVDIDRATGEQCLIDIPRWDFNWQLAYWLETPLRVSPSDFATITCTYNTMERDETVTWGDGTLDEMCLSYVYLTL